MTTLTADVLGAGTPTARDRGWRRLLRRMLSRGGGRFAIIVLSGLIISAVLAPWLAPHSTTAINHDAILDSPSWSHPLGTDELGRDVLVRLLYGGRVSLGVAFSATALALAVGLSWGACAAIKPGWLDEGLMRIVDGVLAIPGMLLALMFVAAFGSSTQALILVLGLLYAPIVARVSRSAFLAELSSDYVVAVRATGASGRRVFAEVLPNAAPALIVQTALVMAGVILAEAGLSFIGLGLTPPETSWGSMLVQGYQLLSTSTLYIVFPGAVIFVAVLAFNLLGDALDHALDPGRHS